MTRSKNYEISDEQFVAAIAHLEEGGTKKRACEILKVSNNKTMERLIQEWQENKAFDRDMRKKMRRKAIQPSEVVNWIEDYLRGSTIAELSDRYYRSQAIIKERIEINGALLRQNEKIDVLNPPLLPEICVSESFNVGDKVWSAKYGCIAEVVGTYKDAYRIRVANDSVQEFAYQAVSELGNLEHLVSLGVDLTRVTPEYTRSCMNEVNRTIHEMNKKDRKR